MHVGAHKRELGTFSDVLFAVLAYLLLLDWHVRGQAGLWYVDLVPIIVGTWWLLSTALRKDVPYRLGGMGAEVRDTLAVNAGGAVVVLCLSLLTKHLEVSRLVLAGFPLLSAAAAIGTRLAARTLLAAWRSRGHDIRHVLLVGPADSAARLGEGVLRPETGLRGVGLLLPEAGRAGPPGTEDGDRLPGAAGVGLRAGGTSPGGHSRGDGNALARAGGPAAGLALTAAGAPVATLDRPQAPPRPLPRAGAAGGLPVLGTYGDLADVLHERVVDQIAVTAPLDDPGLRPVLDVAAREGKTIWLVLDTYGARLMGQGRPGQIVVLSPQVDSYSLLLKRGLDIAVAAVCLFLASPVMAACALAIRVEDPSAPVLFRQTRVGLHGRSFTCFKFRSMVPDAERRRQALLAHNEMDGPVFKIRRDPRVTRVGRVLRKYSLDELPQLWNVLVGDMSLVGPRPPLPDEVRQYRPEFRRRLAFRPGLTCLWQVSGRNRVDFQRWMELDLSYVDNWSFWLDLKILLKTIPVVLFGSGM